MKHKIFLLLGFFLMAMSCADQTTDPGNNQGETTGEFVDFQEMVIDFGLSSFQRVVNDGEDNVLISPLSLETALYMTMNGSDGETLEEFRTALKADKFYPPGMNPHYKTLMEKLEPKNETTTLGSANTVFYDDRKVTFHDEFKDIIQDTYEGDFNQADFADTGSVDLINDWASDNTEGRIKKILEKIEDYEALFLINALYFKAEWEGGFVPASTFESEFTKEDGSEVPIDLMISDYNRRYYIGEDFSALDMKFKDDEYSMTFILPENNQSIKDFVNGYNQQELYDLYIDLYTNKLEENRVMVRLPKFEIEAHKNMKEVLMDMGLKNAFEDADLSKMGTFPARTFISKILHDTFLKIDENGAEGAAVTTVGIGLDSAPPVLDFTRPFLFIIRHVETNTPIFIGKLGDPS